MSSRELRELVDAAARHNAQSGVCGVLLAFGDAFMHVLEGPDAIVRAVFMRIVADTRHRDVTLIRDTRVEQPMFADWSMHLIEIDDQVRRDIAPLLLLVGSAARGDGRDADRLRQIDDTTWRTLGERVTSLRRAG